MSAPASASASAVEPEDSATDWEQVAARADGWTDDDPGRSWDGGGNALVLRRPVELPAPSACAPAARRIPVVRQEPVTVGPSAPFPDSAVIRVLRRDASFLACASCTGGTDVFQLRVGADGSVHHVYARARTHDDAARTECLRAALASMTFPASSRGPEVFLVVPIRVRVAPP